MTIKDIQPDKRILRLNIGVGAIAGFTTNIACDDTNLSSQLFSDDHFIYNIPFVAPKQTHTTNVGIVENIGQEFQDTDAVITRLKHVAIGIRTADCVPIVLYAPDIEAVAAIHAGWRGTLGGIVNETVNKLKGMGANILLMHAAFGPSVCKGCYEVSEELATQFKNAGFSKFVSHGEMMDPLTGDISSKNSFRLDLEGINRARLIDLGVKDKNIASNVFCTRHEQRIKLPSWRLTKGTDERLITLITLT